ncbi:MAG: hypothetical protein KDD70_06150 [Bdellovibrionales bacterium]|nr:hypothetical protein [Bdellovibrionales bacterium]
MKMNDLAELAECFRYLTEESHQSSFLSIFDASLKAVPSVSEARRDTQLVLSSDIPNYRMRQILLRLLRKVREGNQELLQLTGLYRSLFCSHQSEGEKQVTSVVCSIERELTPPLESRRRIRAGKILFQEGVTSSRVDLRKCYARWCDVPGE